MADFVRRATGEGQAIVLGNGYGGFVALQMAIRHPGLAQRLVLADCGARFSEPGRQAFRNMAAVAEIKGLEAIAETAMRRLFAPAFQEANPALLAERRAAFLQTDMVTFRQACLTLADLDLTPDLHKVSAPALVMVGEEDEATPPQMAVALAEGLPDARLVRLPGLAHVPMLQAPELFLQQLDPFLAEAG
jgi:3-oxoadipate enol-lactonase